MNTKYLMLSSALVMGSAGILFTFMPQEFASFIGLVESDGNILLLQLLGALYLSFALLNWMARANLIGGIYSKPVAMGNFTHFFIGSVTLLKSAMASQRGLALWAAAIIYAFFAILFGRVGFTSPLKKPS